MPKPQTDLYWQSRIRHLVAKDPGIKPSAIFAQLKVEYTQNEALYDKPGGAGHPPAESTCRDYRNRFVLEDQDVRRNYEAFDWGQHVGAGGVVPAEASRVALDLVRFFQETGRGVPSCRLVKWFFRVFQAAPYSEDEKQEVANEARVDTVKHHLLEAAKLAAWEEMRELGRNVNPSRAAEQQTYLAFKPWVSLDNERAYLNAINRGEDYRGIRFDFYIAHMRHAADENVDEHILIGEHFYGAENPAWQQRTREWLQRRQDAGDLTWEEIRRKGWHDPFRTARTWFQFRTARTADIGEGINFEGGVKRSEVVGAEAKEETDDC